MNNGIYMTAVFPGVDQFQVIQERVDNLTRKIIKNEQFSGTDTVYFTNKVRTKTYGQIEIDILFVDDIPVSGRSGKRRYVISNVPFAMKHKNGSS